MRDVLLAAALFAASAFVSERLIAGKLQTAIGRVLAPYLAGLVVALVVVTSVEPAALLAFWIGLLATWFGVRSHLESSILLEMLIALRDGGCSRDALLARCRDEYGPAARTGELVRGGFLARTPEGVMPTRKGRLAARAAKLFR